MLQLCFELAKLSLHSFDGQVLVPELLRLGLEISQLLKRSLVVYFQLCYPGCRLLQKRSNAMHEWQACDAMMRCQV